MTIYNHHGSSMKSYKRSAAIKDIIMEHAAIMDLTHNILEHIESRNFDVLGDFIKLRFMVIEHFLNEDLLIFPHIINSIYERRRKEVSLYNDEPVVYYGSFFEITNYGISGFSDHCVKQELVGFAIASAEIVEFLTGIIQFFSRDYIEKNMSKIHDIFRIIEERNSYEEQNIYSKLHIDSCVFSV